MTHSIVSGRSRGWPTVVRLALVWFAVASLGALLSAQFQMPDPRQMSGIPRPVDDLPAGSISVRLIRGSLSNNITGHPVDLRITTTSGSARTETVKTDDAGRAQFDKVPAGAKVQATADVDGEQLESQEFTAPSTGGIRLLLVATDRTKSAEATAPAVPGQVLLGNQSRIVLEPADEALNVFYLLDISNTAQTAVNPTPPFAFTLPKGALGAGIMEGSSPQASLVNGRVIVQAPLPPGETYVQVGFVLPASDASVDVTQTFPARLESLAVVAKKSAGTMSLASPQISNQREMPADGETFIAATGGPVNAGQSLTLTVDGLPHHNSAPRVIALGLAALIVAIAVVAAGPSNTAPAGDAARAAERKRLVAKREKLLNALVRLEADHRETPGDAQYAARRTGLVEALERVYGALDSDGSTPDPARGSGLAA